MNYPKFQVFDGVWLSPSLFWDVKQRGLVDMPKNGRLTLEDGYRPPETSVTDNQPTPRNIPKERMPQEKTSYKI
jgi:hypothetical protein